jgi:hypothetical protein
MSRALAAWCIFVLGCCGDSPHLQVVHTHALCIGQVPLSPVNPLYQRISSTLLREMNNPPSLRSVQGSIETQTASTILRELDNYSLWKSSTKPKHSASYYRHQPSGLTDFLSSTAAEHLLLTSPVHAWTVTQDDKVRECEIIYTLTLTLQFGKSLVRLNMLMIMHGHGSQRRLPHVIRWSVYKPSSHEHFVMCMWPYCTGITSVLESRLYLQSNT